MRCLGISDDGDQCELDAGYGDTTSTHFCHYHDDQFAVEIPFDEIDGYLVSETEPTEAIMSGDSVVYAQMASGARIEYNMTTIRKDGP